MYKRNRRRTAALWIGGGVAVGLCAAVIGFLIYTLALRSGYRAMCLEINDAILSTPAAACAVGRDGEVFPADEPLLNYYDRFLLDRGTVVFNRKAAPVTERTICLALGDKQLFLTGLDDDTAVNIRWVTPEGSQSYTVRATLVTFSQLRSYYVNYKNHIEP